MLSNGGFDSSAGWTLDGSFTISGGVLNVPRENGAIVSQLETIMTGPLLVNTNYRLAFTLNAPNGHIDFKVVTVGDDLVTTASYSTGLQTINFTTPAAWSYPAMDKGIGLYVYYSQAGQIDNISLIRV